jgi:hypothetical protein
MFLRPDCIPCILPMTISFIKKFALDKRSIKKLYTEILKIPALRGRFWDSTSAEFIADTRLKKNSLKINFWKSEFTAS